MENYSILYFELKCTSCWAPFTRAEGKIHFFWGVEGEEYKLDDCIRWKRKRACSILKTLKRISTGEDTEYGNEAIEELYAFDCDDNYNVWQCTRCGVKFDGPAVHIRNGKIEDVKLFGKGEIKKTFGFDLGLMDVVYKNGKISEWKLWND